MFLSIVRGIRALRGLNQNHGMARTSRPASFTMKIFLSYASEQSELAVEYIPPS
jgi:hypothetical protein